jgi:hypothetical protein
MKIVLKKEEVYVENSGALVRIQYRDGEVIWFYPNGIPVPAPAYFEAEYQKLINKPVETTNEQLTREELIDIHMYIKKAFNKSCHDPELERLNTLMKKIQTIVKLKV